MAAQEKEFLIRVAADIKSAQAELRSLGGTLNKLGKDVSASAGLGEVDKAADKATKSVGDLSESIVRFAAAAGVFTTLRAFVDVNLELQAIQATMTAATGDAATAGSEYRFLVEQANRLGLSISALARPYAQLIAASKGTVLEGQATRDIFMAVAEAGSVLKWTTAESERGLRAVQQIMSKGTVSAEELRLQLGDVLPGAMQMAARASGVTTAEFQKMLADGKVLSDQFLPKFAEEIRRTFGPGVEQSIHNLGAEINRLKNNMFQLATAIGEAGVTKFLTDLANAANTGVLALRELIRTGNLLNNQSIQQLAKSFQSSTEGGAPPVTNFLLEGVNTKPSPAASSGPTPDEISAANAAAEKLTETLRMQAAVLKLGEFAAIDYRRAHGDLKNATQEEMQAIYDAIFALAGVREEMENQKQITQTNIEIMRERNKMLEEGTRLQESLRTPMEVFGDEIERLNRLWSEGAINVETYERGVIKAQKAMENAAVKMATMNAEAQMVASTMQGAFSTLFFDVMDSNFENMAKNFSRTLKRMVAEMLASRLFGVLAGNAAGGGGASGSTPAGGGTEGVPSGPPPVASAGPISAARSTGLDRGPSYSPSQDAGFQSGGVTVVIENKGTPQQAQQGRAQFDARGLVVSVVTDDLRSGGPIATTIERTYNTRRKV